MMFNTVINKTSNYDLEIAARERYENKINQQDRQIRDSVTPESLIQARAVEKEAEIRLMFEAMSDDNSLLKCSLVSREEPRRGKTYTVLFTLNGKDMYVEIPWSHRDEVSSRHNFPLLRKRIRDEVASKLAGLITMTAIKNSNL